MVLPALSYLVERASALPQLAEIKLLRTQKQNAVLRGASGSFLPLIVGAESFFVAPDLQENAQPRLSVVLCPEHDAAAHFFTDLNTLIGKDAIFLFPSSYRGRIDSVNLLPERVIQRTETLLNLRRLAPTQSLIIVTYPAALAEKIAVSSTLVENNILLHVGQRITQENLIEALENIGFTQEEFVYEPGQYARRGAIIDLFSYADYYPYRIDFLGDEIDSMRRFAVESQLSIESLNDLQIVGALTEKAEEKALLTNFFPASTIFWTSDTKYLISDLAILRNEMEDDLAPHFATLDEFEALLSHYSRLEYDAVEARKETKRLTFHTHPQPLFHKNFNLIAETLRNEVAAGHHTYIVSEQKSQLERLKSILDDHHLTADKDYSLLEASLHSGFCSEELGVNIFTDHELFERHHAYRLSRQISRRDSLSFTDLQQLKPGDYVVHEDYGVGIFEGLVTHRKDGVNYELVRLSYRDHDSLLMSVHSLDKLSKYRGSEDTPPVLNKLNSSAWNKLKARTKRQVKDIARDLIQLYAQRRAQEGFAFSPDSYLQEELEASFQYEDTPDQLATTIAVKHDMEQNIPMDRLICADVGFGKTEIAIRASFKAVCDNKQVAVLVPTTVLALQHYRTFCRRLTNFPCKVAILSRLQTSKQQKNIIAELAEGKIDIVIGTHSLLRSTIRFKDLGLLVVDEEQKFGVAAKEHLKAMRTQIDTLTLTATPIPRTLQFSLMGARDMSVIATPPPNRQPIETEVMMFDEARVAAAIRREVQRGGQVFFVNNLVQNLTLLHARLEELLPEVRFGVAHGQMRGADLEQVMLEFMNGDYDVLLCTSIVEAGLDIQNVNTIFINNGHRFGLSDLHQLRGRVGRSDRKAYCYILIPMTEILTQSARQRLKAIVEYSDLGSGMSLAMQDLNIRGAGDLLGAEQSGFIVDLGLETYYKILDEAVEELKHEEFAELFTSEQTDANTFVSECVVDSDLALYLPAEYVESTSERMRLYRKLTALQKSEDVQQFIAELQDRFGELPNEARELLKIPELKWTARKLGIQRIQLQNKIMVLQFVTPMTSPFYATDVFGCILKNIASFGNQAQLRQTETSLSLVVRGITDLTAAQEVLTHLAS